MSIAYSIHNKRFSIFDQKLLILLLVVYVCLLLPQIRVQYPQFQWAIIMFPIKQLFGWYTTQTDTQTKTVYCWSIIPLYSIKIHQFIPMISALNIYIIHQISRHISRIYYISRERSICFICCLYLDWVRTTACLHCQHLTCCRCWHVANVDMYVADALACSREGWGGCNNVPDYTKTVKFSYIATGGVVIIGVIWPVAVFFMLYVRSWQFRFQNNIITMYRSWDNSTKGQPKLGHRKVSFEMLTYGC